MYLNTIMKNHFNLNFSFPILKEGFIFPKPKTYVWDIFLLDAEEFASDQAIEFFKTLDLNLQGCHIFRGAPATGCGIHVDGHISNKDSQPVWAINWILNSNSSTMFWYKPLHEGSEIKTHVGTAYQRWNLDQVEEIEKASFTGPTLVRTDIPHRVVNYDLKNPRWCISIRTNKTFSTWEESVDFFKPYIIND